MSGKQRQLKGVQVFILFCGLECVAATEGRVGDDDGESQDEVICSGQWKMAVNGERDWTK